MLRSATPESIPYQCLRNNLEPFFVLQRASVPPKPEKGSSASGRARRKIGLASDAASETRGSRVDDQAQLYGQLRTEAFDSVWLNMETSIKVVLQQVNAKLFHEIVCWVRESFEVIRSFRKQGVCEAILPYPLVLDTICKPIYTTLVLTRNAEFVDDFLTFKELGVYLKNHGSHVANLSSLDFTVKTGIGGCLRQLLKQLVGMSPDCADIAVLASWYIEPGHFDKPVVVIIKDMERCDGATLAEFIAILSEWAVKLPIILVFGVATTVNAPMKLLPLNTLQHLHISKFTLGSPIDKMDAVIGEVLVKSRIGFHIGYKVASYLRNLFLKHDGTVTSFIRALKIACVKHFSMEPLSFLAIGMVLEDSQEFWINKCELLPNEMLKYAFGLPSCPENFADKSSRQNSTHLVHQLSKLKRSLENWSSVVMCLCEAGKLCNIRALDIFCEAVDPDFYKIRSSDYFLNKIKRSKESSMTDYNQFGSEYSDLGSRRPIAEAVQKVRDLPFASLSSLLYSWQKLTEEMGEINEKVKELQAQVNLEDGEKSQKLERQSIRGKSILLGPERKSSTVNDKAALLLESMIGECLIPVECMPCHEIICFKRIDVLQSALIGDPRRTVQVDLLKSHIYLRCSCCSRSKTSLQPNMHDTSMMYNLSQEHGDLINLFDWYQSFKAAVCPSTKSKQKDKQSPKSKKRKVDNSSEEPNEAVLQARFCRAVTELQITGLLRMPSKRRPDFVQRVAFGV